MQRITTIELTPADLTSLVADMGGGTVKVSVPRTENGELSASIEISADEFKAGLASALEIDVATLDTLKVSNKKDGGISVAFSTDLGSEEAEEDEGAAVLAAVN